MFFPVFCRVLRFSLLMKICLYSAVNNDSLYRNCLLSSPDIAQFSEVSERTGFYSAASAYNSVLETCIGRVAVLAHQDVYLPPGWLAGLKRKIRDIESIDPNWGVVGLYGVSLSGVHYGSIFCTGQMRWLGAPFSGAVEVGTLDEVLLVVRIGSGLYLDPSLDAFHMYGADICLEARRRGMKCYSISLPCLHNTNPYLIMPSSFWRCYFILRRKWLSQLPVHTSCTTVTRYAFPVISDIIRRRVNSILRRKTSPGFRVQDPAVFWRSIAKGCLE